jgi:Na+-transporting methylmalonyl-CoA/oxaloacetate decarboxylase gamma subunit
MTTPRPSRRERARQLREVYRITKGRDSRLPLVLLGTLLGTWAIVALLGWAIGWLIPFAILGLLIAVMVTMGVFYRRATRSALAEVEGTPGAAAGVLSSMRGDWQVTPAVAFNVNQDLVHRVVGRPGVILVGEGNPGRVRSLLAQERRRVNRVAAEVPVTEIVVGDDEGQVPLRKLQTHVMRLPRTLKPAQASEVKKRMRALGGPQPPIPKGPMPRAPRMPRGKIR